jgi:hypothetical protein
MTLYLCPKSGQWSHEPCDCPNRDADDDTGLHSANEVPDPETTVARLINLIGATHDGLADGDAVMDDLAEAYLEITGNLI